MTSEELNRLSWYEYNKLMADELNKEGIPCHLGVGGNKTWIVYQDPTFPLINSVTRQSQVDFLVSKGLINNGRCPNCGKPIYKNLYTYEHSMYHYKYVICKDCYDEGKSFQSGMSGSRGGCIVALALMPYHLIRLMFDQIQQIF